MQKKIITNMIWRFAERFGAKGVQFVVSVILARLLMPEVYGTIALVSVFTTVLQVFVDGGMANAVIQKKDADHLDFSTIFYFNMAVCLVLYIGMFFAAVFIADFYKDPSLIPVIRTLSLTLVISGLKNVQQAYVSRTMQFKKFFFATFGGTLGAAVLGIMLAYKGFGVWALVAQSLFNNLADTVILWFSVKWRPGWEFSFERLRRLFSYGWKLLGASLLYTCCTEIRALIIGKVYSSADLAFYNQGEQLPKFIIMNLDHSISAVLFPVLSGAQDEMERIRSMTRRSLSISTYCMAPLMMGLAGSASTFVRIFFTDKWLPCVPYLRIFCLAWMLRPLVSANLGVYKAIGRSDIFLKLDIIKQTGELLMVLITMHYGVFAIALGTVGMSFLGQVINTLPNSKILNYTFFQQLKDMLPSLGLACMMGICVWAVGFLEVSKYIALFIQVVTGVIIYIAGSILMKNNNFYYMLDILKSFIHRR